MREPVVHPDPWRQADAPQFGALEFDDLRDLRIGQRMRRHVHQRRGRIAHRLVALVEAPRSMQLGHQRVGYRLSRQVVPRMALQHFRFFQPVLEQLRRQLDEVAQHVRARHALVSDVGQQAVQTVAEFVEQRACIIKTQQRRLTRRAAREVVVVDDDGQRARVARLLAKRTHPRATALARAREVVVQEHTHHGTPRVTHFIDFHVGVIRLHIGHQDEAQTEQAIRAIEYRVDHALEREVGFDHRLVDVIARLAHLLGVEAPVPGFDRQRLAMRQRQRRKRFALFLGARLGRPPHLLQQLGHGLLGLGHRVGECIVGERRVAVQTRLLIAQAQDLARHRPVVVLAVMLAACRPGAPGLFAQVAAL